MKFAPDKVEALAPNEVMVFGANRAGRHTSGAAQYARQYLGAKYGIGEGLTGQCYALPIKGEDMNTLSLSEIRVHVEKFFECARALPEKVFLVTGIGTAFAPLFIERPTEKNVRLPRAFHESMKGYT